MRLTPKQRRRLWIGGAIAGGVLVVGVVAAWVLYPRIGAWAIRSKVVPRIEARLDRDLEVEAIEVSRGQAVLRGITIAGPADAGKQPLARIERVVVDYDYWPSLRGVARVHRVTVEGLSAVGRRGPTGDNFEDLVDRLRGRGDDDGGDDGGGGGMSPDELVVRDAEIELRDELTGMRVVAGKVGAVAERGGPLQVTLRELSAESGLGPEATLESLVVTASSRDVGGTAEASIYGGRVSLWPGMSLTGIRGTVASGDRPGRLELDLSGGYGGAEGRLWQGQGWLDRAAGTGELALKAERFTFDRIGGVLADSMVIDYDDTSIDADVQVTLAAGEARIAGRFALTGLNVFHPMISDLPLRDLDLEGAMDAVYDRGQRRLSLVESELTSRGVTFHLDGDVWLRGGMDLESGERRERSRLAAHLVIPPLPCQEILDAIPPELASHLQGMKVRGTFGTDVRVAIDRADLEATELGGSIGIFRCRAVQPPRRADARRLLDTFTHYVEDGRGDYRPVVIGPENPDYVPLWDVSPHLINSLVTTEDSTFYRHRGFIVPEFRTALIRNLEAGYFKFGASSITMQMVKNVFLYREKTLSRKLQELVLTWYIEQELDKDRIMEIYVNAIEYGPGIYGIGPAAYHYFGKHPRDLNPREAAFFSSTLPDPKRRYRQYCRDRMIPWLERKVERIIDLMHKRERLEELDYEEAKVTPLVFDRTDLESVQTCLDRVERYLKNKPTAAPGDAPRGRR